MKVIMYGAEICPDGVAAKERLAEASGIELEYRNITGDTATLKEFLRLRDHSAVFAPVVAEGRIGIPLFILEDGAQTLELDDFLGADGTARDGSACSIDGKGC